MKFLNKQQVINAIEKIDNENLAEDEPIIYILKYNGKSYSPLQVVNLAYLLVYDKDSEKSIYSIEEAINILKDLDFEIDESHNIWKLGCNWGAGAPSFYEVLKAEKVVLDWWKFKVGDLILITEGFTVRALGKIISESIPDQDNERLSRIFKNYKVFDEVNICKIEFYELPKVDVFAYELQQGIVNVRKKAVRFNSVNLWMNRNRREKSSLENEKLEFRSYFFRNNNYEDWKYPCIGLKHLTNEKNGVRNSFQMTYFYDEKNRIEIGVILIYMSDNYITELERSFDFLDINYCSIGSTVEFYYRLKESLPQQYDTVLKNLNDIARNQDVRDIFKNDIEMKKALLNTSETEYILNQYEDIINSTLRDNRYDFEFHLRIGDAVKDHIVDFSFGSSTEIINRFFCLVGKNATGKTKFLSQFANKLTDNSEAGNFTPQRPGFSKVIAASFSFFDKFRFPEKRDTNYDFIGIKNSKGMIDEEEYSNKIWEAYKSIVKEEDKMKTWLKCLESSLEVSHLNFNISELQGISTKKDFTEKTDGIFSSGQNIVFQFVTRFIECIEVNSILIFDEPETHLHPNIAGRLLRTINNILIEFKSFAVLATHSPIILQEIPSKFIRIFDRQENYPLIYSPTIECYGEDISTISNSIFKIEEEKELYRLTLEKLIETGHNSNEINSLFDNKLGLSARLLLKSLEK